MQWFATKVASVCYITIDQERDIDLLLCGGPSLKWYQAPAWKAKLWASHQGDKKRLLRRHLKVEWQFEEPGVPSGRSNTALLLFCHSRDVEGDTIARVVDRRRKRWRDDFLPRASKSQGKP